MSADNFIKILFVEDLPPDMELAEIELEKNGINFVSRRVERRDQFIAALHDFKPDLVISDYSLPQFNGMEASIIAREYDRSLPFIILTGTQNEEIAVECMKAGATDYVMKEHIIKLSFAVREALRYRDAMCEKAKAEESLLESESRYRSMFENNYAVMILVDPENGSVVDVNPAASEYYGISRENFARKKISEITLADENRHEQELEMAFTGNRSHVVSRHKIKNGVPRDVEIFCSPVNYMKKKLVHCIIQDVTEKNKAVEALKTSLNEKKQLIREIYHRTKNNMQVIISMFALESDFSGDDKLRTVLKDMESRIRAMSLVHDKLYQSQNLSKLNLQEYLTELVNSIISGSGLSENAIYVNNTTANMDVLIDTAIPCGLVVNELVSDMARHVSTGGESEKIKISMDIDQTGIIRLVLENNDREKVRGADFSGSEHIGLRIAKNIVEYQLKGSIKHDNSDGFKWIIAFKDDVYEERV